MNPRWFYAKDKKKQGPVSTEELHRLLTRGELQPTDMILQEGSTRWAPASSLLEAASNVPPRLAKQAPAATVNQTASRPGWLWRCASVTVNGLTEVPRAFGAVGSQTARALGYWGCKRQANRLNRLAQSAQLDLGTALFKREMGDPQLRRQLVAAEEALQIIREAKGSATKALRERQELLLKLSEPWLRSATPPPGLEAEHRRVVVARRASEQQEQARAHARAALLPAKRADRARVWAGAGLLAALLIAGVLLLLPWGSSAERTGGEVIATAAPTREPVSTTNPAKGGDTAEVPAKNETPPQKLDPPKKVDPPSSEQPPTKKSLKELYRLLSPAVPMVETPGAGGGSGFLLRHKERYLVVTNRHVIEPARNGLEVYFLRTTKQGQEERLKIPPEKIKLVAVHRTVDLAVLDVSAAAEEITKWDVQPVSLAKSDHVPAVGEHVFAIGHPGDAAGGVLTRTLSDGIVSAVNRKDRFARGSFTQVTVAINPGNSGGPIFDDEGKVIAVATFIIRRSKDRDLALEALNFGLDTRFVHELLDDPSQSLTQAEIAARFGKGKQVAMLPPALMNQMQSKLKQLLAQGFKPFTGNLKTSMLQFRLSGDGNRVYTLPNLTPRDQMYLFVVSHGSDDVDLHVIDRNKRLVVQDIRVNPDPEVTFRPRFAGNYVVVVSNLTPQPADGILIVLVK